MPPCVSGRNGVGQDLSWRLYSARCQDRLRPSGPTIGSTGVPEKHGFDVFFGYYNQNHAHSYYPAYLWRNGQKVMLDNHPPIPGHAKLADGADPNDPASYAAFKGKDYSPDRMIEAALQFIRENKDGPFFLYLAHNYC